MIEVVVLRVTFSLLILRFPLIGGLLAIVLDFFDLNLLAYFNHGDLHAYQQLDKMLDLLYLSLEAYVALSWKNAVARYTAFLLFMYRLIGVAIFTAINREWYLIYFPNVFEFFYLTYLLQKQFLKKDYLEHVRVVIIVVLVLLIPKEIHEYLLHVNTYHPWSENPYIKPLYTAIKNL